MTDKVEAFLAHHGVKGMKWGVRKDRGDKVPRKERKKSSEVDAPKKQSRRQRRKEAKRVRNEQYQKRATELLTAAAENPQSLVKVRTQYGHYLLTGREFVSYTAKGGAFDVRTAQIYIPGEEDR